MRIQQIRDDRLSIVPGGHHERERGFIDRNDARGLECARHEIESPDAGRRFQGERSASRRHMSGRFGTPAHEPNTVNEIDGYVEGKAIRKRRWTLPPSAAGATNSSTNTPPLAAITRCDAAFSVVVVIST